MEDKDFLTDILSNEKAMTVNIATALNEASCNNLYKKFHKMFCNISEAQKDLFEMLYGFGWYNLEEAESKNIDQELKKLKNDLDCIE